MDPHPINRITFMKLKFSQGANINSQQGFSMLETMAAALVSLVFMSLGANLVLAANLHKVVAKRNVAMSNYIQSDIEAIKYQANSIAKDITNRCPSTAPTNAAAAAVLVQGGYGDALKDKLLTTAITGNTAQSSTTTVKILNQDYEMTRTLEPIRAITIAALTAPNNIVPKPHSLPISYEFRRKEPGKIMAIEYQMYIEITPNAALECPA